MKWIDKVRAFVAGKETLTPSNAEPSFHHEVVGGGEGLVRLPDAAKPARRVPVVIGLDFGTSCSKIVVRAANRAHAVPFPEFSGRDNPFLLPSRLWLQPDGRVSLERNGAGKWVARFKVATMAGTVSEGSGLVNGTSVAGAELSACFVACAIRMSRAWFEKRRNDLILGAEVIWQINMGLPAKSHDDHRTRDAFRRVLLAGWDLADAGQILTIGAARDALERAGRSDYRPPGISEDSVNVIPEVAAEVVGYARSNQRRLGPHLIVDVGATTLDACLFLLSESGGEYSYAFLDADVRIDLGAFPLNAYRLTMLGAVEDPLDVSDPLSLVPRSVREYPGATIDSVSIDDEFRDRCEEVVRGVAVRAKRKAPRDLTVNGNRQVGIDNQGSGEIRIMLTGGGSLIPLYGRSVVLAGHKVAPGGGLGLRMKPFGSSLTMEMPDSLVAPDLTRGAYHRLAVAYGLSYSVDNIGRYIPPSAIDELTTWHRAEYGQEFVGKEFV